MKSIYKPIVKVTDNKTAAFVYELPSVTQSGKDWSRRTIREMNKEIRKGCPEWP
jgi:hypothetical protein